jgi:hypothetical protein
MTDKEAAMSNKHAYASIALSVLILTLIAVNFSVQP